MSRVAKVAVDISLDREFDYVIPDGLRDSICLGTRVAVPFGARQTEGYVVGLAETSARAGLKEIRSLVGEGPFIGEHMLELAKWMSRYYCAPLESSLKTLLPGPVRRRGMGFKQRLFVSPVEGAGAAADLDRMRKRSPRQAAVLEALMARGEMPVRDVTALTGASPSVVRALEKKGVVRIASADVYRDPVSHRHILPTCALTLTAEQAAALDRILAGVRDRRSDAQPSEKSPNVVLLYGVTGSGKTEVYLQAIDFVLSRGMGAIVLVPEISLTPQTVERFVSRFGERIAVLHSHLSDGERHDEWHRVRNGAATIVVGARSAVFAPVANLGLIVVDEEHEPSYKQEEAPRYNARDVAVMRGRMEGCAVVLGSATPSLESWRNVGLGKYALSRLAQRADNRKMPAIRVVDMRIEVQRTGHVSVFSGELIEAVRARLDKAEQTMLFLNRRGFATSLTCPKCGYVASCDSCSVTFTYHRPEDSLRCHICGAARAAPRRCPSCRDPAFKFVGIGTQRVEAVAQKIFPHARIQRMDTDVTRRKRSHDTILGDFKTGAIDILVGTQMIAKGLHFPNVTLVGIVYADTGLHLPDFRAAERTFQLLAQVAGRAGRGDVSGEVIVQTFTPFHPAVQFARRSDFEGFCDQEMEFRRELSYPPFAHLVCLTLKGRSEEKVAFCASAMIRKLRPRLPRSVTCSDPTPAPLAKAKGFFRYQIIMRAPTTRSMVTPVRDLLGEFRSMKEVSCSVDVDALNIL